MTTATALADALAERLPGATLGALEPFSVHSGAELGPYGSLAQRGPQTADELAGTLAPATTPREYVSLPTASSSSPAAAPRNDHGGDLSWPSR